jgi:hypothetical protein
MMTSLVTFIDENEGLSNSFDSGSESDVPFPPSEDRPSDSPKSSSPSLLSRNTLSPSLGSTGIIPDSDSRSIPRTPKNDISFGDTDSSAHGELGQENIAPKPAMFSHHDFAQLSPSDPTAKALPEEDSIVLSYAKYHHGFQISVVPQPLPSIYLDTPVWPLTDPSEAVLLRHFVQNLATWVGYRSIYKRSIVSFISNLANKF